MTDSPKMAEYRASQKYLEDQMRLQEEYEKRMKMNRKQRRAMKAKKK